MTRSTQTVRSRPWVVTALVVYTIHPSEAHPWLNTPTVADIGAAIGNEVEASGMVSRTITDVLRSRRSLQVVVVSGEQIPGMAAAVCGCQICRS